MLVEAAAGLVVVALPVQAVLAEEELARTTTVGVRISLVERLYQQTPAVEVVMVGRGAPLMRGVQE
jgi:hypothetical protein